MATTNTLTTNCCIAGGGPAGMMLGFLLARAGIEVIVLEKHADFFRDFRGDTIHPSTIQLMHELGLLDEFMKVPHQEMKELGFDFNNNYIHFADFTHLPIPRPVLALMPQWDFLNFIQKQAATYPTFKLMMNAKVTDLVMENGRVMGVIATSADGDVEIRANLVVGTDGRSSTIREKAGLNVIKSGVPIDVLWFRVSRLNSDPPQTFGRFEQGHMMVMLNRDSYWQCAYIIDKGGFDEIQQDGLPAFRTVIRGVSPFLDNRVGELKTWDDIKLLTVDIDHLEQWYADGVLCIGDAAHAMSPIGGVGINLAIQDAVATANILYPVLRLNKPVDNAPLQAVQKRREFPTKFIQRGQVFVQDNLISKREQMKDSKPPFIMRAIDAIPPLRRLPARIVGMGVRPEHVRTPDVRA